MRQPRFMYSSLSHSHELTFVDSEFTDTTGEKYCGQSCNIPKRLEQHKKAGKLDPDQRENNRGIG